ncbi:8862_t:CDS:2 [Cetraspora pellucida]|uniref:8862_t:CDS:1 n=1 Tax=Cetraspora pellucida TaxID=1433469 RepID=A0A9N9J4Q3_9GLOM|nr:8862_t:CDS:2 [Cetraspora pellucida]
MNDENQSLQQEELFALTSIFGTDSFKVNNIDELEEFKSYSFKLSLENESTSTFQSSRSENSLTLQFYLPKDYPTSQPTYEITSLYCGTLKIDNKLRNEIDKRFKELFVPGDVVLFEWIEFLREFMQQKLEQQLDKKIQREIKEELIVDYKIITEEYDEQKFLDESADFSVIKSGEPLEHKKSVFIAHLASVHNVQEVQIVRNTLLSKKKIAKATHNIMAYRIVQENGVILQDNDDDGETAAGSRLLHLLQILGVKNVIVVVSRWYGGIKLGPDRFKDINNCARDLLDKYGYIQNSSNINPSASMLSNNKSERTKKDKKK